MDIKKKIFKSRNNRKNLKHTYTKVHNISELKSHINGYYVPQNIKHTLKFYNTCNKLTIYCESNNIINFFIITKNKNITKAFVDHLCIYAYTAVNVLSQETRNRNINVIFLNSNILKKLPVSKCILGPEHVNTGFAYIDDNNPINIVIYRREEFFKTLIHELVHYYNYHPVSTSQLIDSLISNVFPIVTANKILFTEAYTECIANRLNVLLIHYLFDDTTSLKEKIKLEHMFSVLQAQKILDFNKIQDVKDARYVYNENTNVFAYYILKSALLCEKRFNKQYLANFNMLDYTHTFMDVLRSAITSNKWINNVQDNKFKLKVLSKINSKSKYKIQSKSLRMTINDVEKYF